MDDMPAPAKDVDPATAAGRAAENAGELPLALQHFQASLARDPDAVPRLLDVARVLMSLGRSDEAEPLFQRVLQLKPGRPRALRGLARIARGRGDDAAAAELLRQAAAASPADTGLLLDLADVLICLGQFGEAAEVLRAAERLDRDDPRLSRTLEMLRDQRARTVPSPEQLDALLAEADAAEGTSEAADTLARVEAALDSAPGHSELLFARARLLLGLGRRTEAEGVLEGMLESDPRDARAALALADSARARGDIASAIRALEMPLAAGTREFRLQLRLAPLLIEAGRPQEAEAAYREAQDLAPKDPRPLAGLAQLAAARGATEQAVALLEQAVGLAPHDATLAARLVRLLAGAGRLAEARRACETALSRHPRDPRLLMLAADLARQDNDLRSAIACLRSAADVGEAAPQALPRLVRALLDAGATEEAMELAARAPPATTLAMARAARLAGHEAAAAGILGRAAASGLADRAMQIEIATELRTLNRPEEAVRLLEAALCDRPADADLWLALGLARRAAGTDALPAFLRAAELAPEAPIPLREACREYLARGELRNAEVMLRRALPLDPASPETLRLAVSLLRAAGDDASALTLLARIHARQPAAWVDEQTISVLGRLGRWEEALAVFDRWEARDGPSPLIASRRARMLERRGVPDAAALLEEARARMPEHPELWWQQIWLWIGRGMLRQAAEALASPPAFALEAPARIAAARGRIAEAEWRITDAAALYAEALALRPDDATTHEWRARIMLLRNDPETAVAHLRDRARLALAGERFNRQRARARQGLLGRVANEYLLEPELMVDLRAAQDLPIGERLPRLMEIAREVPEHSAPAIAVLLALRQSGAFDWARTGGSSPIPWRITQYWNRREPPPDVAELMASWPAMNPGFAYVRLDAAAAEAYLRAHHPPDVLLAFRRALHPAQQADILRLAVLAREGGVYADADDRCIGPIDTLLLPGARFVGYQEYGATIGNNFLAAVPGHPVVTAALREAVFASLRGDRASPWLDTGPALLSRCLVAHLLEAGQASGIAILTAAELHAAIANGCAAAYKATTSNWKLEAEISPRSLAMETLRMLGLEAAGDEEPA